MTGPVRPAAGQVSRRDLAGLLTLRARHQPGDDGPATGPVTSPPAARPAREDP